MVKINLTYQGKKHCELVHGPSESRLETDAPRDNSGLGARFSPTDLVAAALASCVVTTMAIVAERDGGPDVTGTRAEIEKEMTSGPPRAIARLSMTVQMPGGVTPEWRKRLEAAAASCPVRRSLTGTVETPMTFHYQD